MGSFVYPAATFLALGHPRISIAIYCTLARFLFRSERQRMTLEARRPCVREFITARTLSAITTALRGSHPIVFSH